MATPLRGQRALVTGGSGLVGGRCAAALRKAGCEVVATHKTFPTDETVYFNCSDMADSDNFDVKGFAPQIIVHCAAWTHVDMCEEQVDESYFQNVTATRNVAALCKECNAKIVFTSTDYVFDGVAGPYAEDAEPMALSVYGKHKLECEQFLLADPSLHAIVLRITNVYGHEARGKNFVARIFKNASASVDGETMNLRLPNDQFATPVDAATVAEVTAMLLADDKSGVYHVSSSEYVSRVQLAARVVKNIKSHKVAIEGVATAVLGQKAPRPLKGGLLAVRLQQEYPLYSPSTVDDFVLGLSK
jgi:dTDP-4-dehydrorhamnose reductase